MNIPSATEHYRQAEAILSGREPGTALGYVYVGLAGTSLWGVQTEQGLEVSAKAVEVAERVGHEILWANAAALQGWHTWASGRPGDGQELLERAYEVADRLEHAPAAFFAAWMRGFSSQMIADPVDGLWWFERELTKPRIAQAPGPRRQLLEGVAQSSFFIGDVSTRERAMAQFPDTAASTLAALDSAFLAGDLASIERVRGEALESGRPRGIRHMTGYHLSVHDVLLELGEFEAAVDRSRAVLEEIASHMPWELWERAALVETLSQLGRVDEAETELEQVRAIRSRGEGWRGADTGIERAVGAVDAARGNMSGANDHFERALEIARRFNHGGFKGRALQAWARALKAAGAAREANDKYDELAEVWRTCGRGEVWFERLDAERPR